jgi:sugar phosphate permease
LSQRWIILIILNAGYFFVYFHRISPAVLAPPMMAEFAASAASLGAMASAYFYPYSLSQPAVGVLTDRWGGRRVVALSTLIAAVGSLLFALAPTLAFAAFGRALIGLGAAGVFVPAMRILLQWFGPSYFAQMNTLLLAVGNIGAIAASTPLAWMVQQTGWRSSFLFIGAVSFAVCVLSWIFIRNAPAAGKPKFQGNAPAPAPPTPSGPIFKNRAFWILIALFFVYGGPFSTFQGLWGYSFLIDVAKYDKIQAGNLLMIIAFGVILGGPVLGYLGDRPLSRHKGAMLSAVILLQAINWLGVTFLGPSLGSLSFAVIFFLMGMSLAGTLALVWSITRETFPSERLGTVMGIINLAPFLAAAIFQPVTGYIMDRVGRTDGIFPFAAYQHAFLLCLASVCLSFLISLSLVRRRGAS